MSDLISRSQLLKEIETCGGCVDALHGYIQNMPTAYDVDNVVNELQENSSRYTKKYVTPYGNNGYKDVKAISIHKAIEIVKHGGVSDDVCEWTLDGVYLNSPHKPLVSCVTDENYRYYYCPVCGKKIKAVQYMDED